ncbi:hypothetical protein Tco_0742094 [Tanacetum coccineum]
MDASGGSGSNSLVWPIVETLSSDGTTNEDIAEFEVASKSTSSTSKPKKVIVHKVVTQKVQTKAFPVKIPVPIKNCILGLAAGYTWACTGKKPFGTRKQKDAIVAGQARKGKKKDILRCREILILDPPAGIFANHLTSLFECDFVSLDPRLESRKSAIDNSFTLGSNEEAYHVNILQSCNGLLLCSDNSHDFSILHATGVLRMAFDPTTSCDYKVVQLFACLHAELEIQLETKDRQLTLYKFHIDDHDHTIITTLEIPNGLHQRSNFLPSFGGREGSYDPLFIQIDIHAILHLQRRLFESCGCLLLVSRDDIDSKEFTIHEMVKGCPMWTVRRRKIPILDPPAGIFANNLTSLFECDFVSLDLRLNFKKITMDHSFGFAKEVDHVRILQSCNGLLLCSGSAWPVSYYVYNLSTNLFKMLLQPNYYLRDDSCFFCCGVFRLAFDPRKSSHYKVVQAGGEAEGLNRELKHCKLNMEDHDHPIMTSLEISHRLNRGRNFLESFVGPINDSILLVIELPHMLHLEGKFFESCGCLLLVCRDDISSIEFTIYEMMKGSSIWSVKYLINIVQLLNPLPEGWSIRTGVWSICLGEREEDAFVVINLSRKVVKYNLISKTNSEIFDIGSNQMDDDDDDDDDADDDDAVMFIPPFEVDPNLYEFIPSLASKYILKGPYTPTIVTTPTVPVTKNSLAVPEQTTVKTVMNMTPENRLHFELEKEAIHLILTGIGDEIYSTVDACQTAQEMWEAIERLQQVATMQVNVQFLQQLQPEWSRFVTIVKQQHKLDEVSYHKLFDILKQYQKEVNELRAERMAKNANPLALVATAQTLQDPYYQSSKPHKSYAPTSKASLPTRSHATTRYKGKEIAKPITPPSESASEEDSDPEQAQRDKDMQKNLALIAKYFKKIYKPTNNNLRTSSNTRNKNVDTTPRYKNDNQTGQFGNQRAVNVVGARETIEQSDWLADTDEEIDEQELEAHYSYMEKIQEVPNADSGTDAEPLEQVQYDTDDNVFANDIQHFEQSESISNTCVVETGDKNVIPDSPDMCNNDIQDDQNDVECDDERVALANLIANLKLDVDENKKIQKQLKKANATLTQELTECKSILAETSRTLRESNSIRDSCLVALCRNPINTSLHISQHKSK